MNKISFQRKIFGVFAVAFALASAVACSSARSRERILWENQSSYQAISKREEDEILTLQLIPKSQKPENWSEMITTQTFVGKIDSSPEEFGKSLLSSWKQTCLGGFGKQISGGIENGYPFVVLEFRCPLSPSQENPQGLFVKVVQGAESLYLVQKAFQAQPTEAQKHDALKFLRSVVACDLERKDRLCPSSP